MITNFDYLRTESKFSRFADVAISAEKIILMDPEASILNSRRAMEFALKWMYSVDAELEMPYQDNLQSLMNAEEYRQIVGPDLWKRMDYIRRCGNNVAHSNKKLGRDQAMLCLENLFIYLDYIAYCYSDQYEERSFDKTIIISRIEKAKEANTPIICAMGAGNKMDPTKFEVADISETSVCPLARVIRTELRKRKIKGVKVVYSKETPIIPQEDMSISCKAHCVCPPGTRKCTVKHQIPGSNAFVPPVVGLIIAGEVIKDLIGYNA